MNSKHRRLTVALAVFGTAASLLASQPALARSMQSDSKSQEGGEPAQYTRTAPSILPGYIEAYDKLRNFMMKLQLKMTFNKV